ncbi:histidine kinase dimerization/phosphoacceptor domain -containing protein [Robertkochia aurantiaca]|uniref:histidine kinase dimerization/phosphoacceptor domain -containing protein n=1 Tax=Robertkochia aurantiaca TaxID=2873700 RepID=UPI001CCBCC34|nr:histidine kinase dimerization/phosphoacceptor domain -containing protein [Robertkochia sp. 3YJGBD-33]
MYRSIFTTLFLSIIGSFSVTISVSGQSAGITDNSYERFTGLSSSEGQLKFFFETTNRYDRRSAYRWLEWVGKAIDSAKSAENTQDYFIYKTIESQIYNDLGNYEKSIQIGEALSESLNMMDFEVKSRMLGVLDDSYEAMQLYNQQLETRMELKELGVDVPLYDIYSNIGLHRQAMIDYANTYGDVLEEGNGFEKAAYFNQKATFLRKDGSVYSALKEYEKALETIESYMDHEMTLTPSDFREAIFLKGMILGNMGKCLVDQGKYEEAIPYIEAGISASREYDRGRYQKNAIDFWTELAKCYMENDDLRLAKAYLDSIDMQPRIVNNKIAEFNRLKANYHLRKNQPDSAATYYNRYMQLKDSLEYNQLRKQLLGLVVSFDLTNQKESIIEQQRMDLERNRSEILQREKTIYLSIVALIFSVLCVIALIIAYIKSIKNKRLIENQKKFIEQSLVEKDSLLKEIHHRVKNNLQMVSSLLSLQSKSTRSKSAINALEEGKNRVKAMALIHQKLYQNEDLSVIEMQEYIESLVASIQSVYKKEGYDISVNVHAEGTQLDVDRAIPIGLILNELVSNSFKYAFNDGKTGNIDIYLKKKGEEVSFEYTDDGVGLPEDLGEVSKGSMGLSLIQRLANQLRSKLNIDRETRGVRFWFNFT